MPRYVSAWLPRKYCFKQRDHKAEDTSYRDCVVKNITPITAPTTKSPISFRLEGFFPPGRMETVNENNRAMTTIRITFKAI
jgi:hypothetical protein